RMELMREQEVAETLRRMPHLAPEDRAAIEHLSRAMMNKFMHEPSVRLKAAAANGRGLGIVDAARYLFGLETGRKSETSGGAAESETEQP
ncbi:MAG TPA: hypothetical protein VFO55_08550, partial [Gemmatimonadaceae bacterium]|nr:hypothetical protein [Gemmatimonadaceae bacterium]